MARSGRWWRTCRGRPSPAAGSTGSRAFVPSPLPPARQRLRAHAPRVEGWGQRLAQRRIHEVAADMRVDRRGGVTAVPDLLLDEPPVDPVLGQMRHIRVPSFRTRRVQRDSCGDWPGRLLELRWPPWRRGVLHYRTLPSDEDHSIRHGCGNPPAVHGVGDAEHGRGVGGTRMGGSGNRGRGLARCWVLGLCMVLLGACTSAGRARPPSLTTQSNGTVAAPTATTTAVPIAWRMTGVGAFTVAARDGRGPARLADGPGRHGSSTWDRPGEEWGTVWVFPRSGCWHLRASRGTAGGDVWLRVS